MLHVTSCFWMASSEANLGLYDTWLSGNGLLDENFFIQYLAAFYWATVTATTVGYGDILPTNYAELVWAMIIIIFGVALFANILSNLSSNFVEITKANSDNEDLIQLIDTVDRRFKLGPEIVEQISSHLTSNTKDEELDNNEEVAYLLKILPSTLKTPLIK